LKYLPAIYNSLIKKGVSLSGIVVCIFIST
jgi:hypothetical protein